MSSPLVLDDPYQWLEAIESDEALAWVRERNARTQAALFGADFEADRARIYEILTRPDSIPFIGRHGGYFYNFWQDATHVRGLWRRTSPESYRSPEPEWEILLDLDALAHQENEDWVWHGCATLEPEHRLGLMFLSRGGSDASVMREFDLELKAFVAGGFELPQAKGGASWIDEDTLLVSSALGDETVSGYARTVRLWKRGTPFESASVVFEGAREDVWAYGSYRREVGFTRTLFARGLDFENSEHFLGDVDGTMKRIEVPLDCDFTLRGDWILVRLRSPWELPSRTFAADSLLAARFSEFMGGSRDFELLFEPAPRRVLRGMSWTRSRLLVTVLDNLASHILVATPPDQGEGWKIEPLSDVPPAATVSVWPLDGSILEATDDFLLSVTGFTDPTTLYLHTPERGLEALKSAPRAFEAGGLEVTRHEAVSVDGERIPYFQIAKAGQSGPRRTLLYGYGGFQVSLLPSYLGATGAVWLEEGGVYVLANIRGGGEFGSNWHKSGMREGKALCHDDFAAVARDLVTRGVTIPSLLAAHGGSNGGLLVGNMLTRYPELFGAIWCSVPLLDMKRFSHLLAGASWIAEYGDPDNPEEWEWMQRFSAYHNVERERVYPPILLVTARHDDRVHPAHARKMAARLEELGHAVHFYEPDDSGGHGAANKEQAALLSALGYAFLNRVLKMES
jgi:prolyl oligopeptidase